MRAFVDGILIVLKVVTAKTIDRRDMYVYQKKGMLVLALSHLCFSLSRSQTDELLMDLDNIDFNLRRHLDRIAGPISSSDFILKYNPKLRSKLMFMKNIDKVKNVKLAELDLPSTELVTHVIQINSIIGRFLGKKAEFRVCVTEPAIAVSIAVYGGNETCSLKEFNVRIDNQKNAPMNVGQFRLAVSEEWQVFKFPNPVLFECMVIDPVSNYGNETHYCLPEVTVRGDRAQWSQ